MNNAYYHLSSSILFLLTSKRQSGSVLSFNYLLINPQKIKKIKHRGVEKCNVFVIYIHYL